MNEQTEPTPAAAEPVATDEVITTYDAPAAPKRRPWIKAVAIGTAGLLAGGVAAITLSASADEATTSTSTSTSAAQDPAAATDPSQTMRSDEELLTGDTKSKVEAAVLKEYPGATIERTETDSGGVYESHIVTADGEGLTVLVDKDFAVTGTEAGHGGRGDHDGDGPGKMGEAPPADAPAVPPADAPADTSSSSTDSDA